MYSADIFKIELTFDSRYFIYSVAHAYETCNENVTFVIGKLNFRSNQFVLGAFPLTPRSLLDNEMSLHTYTIICE